MCVYRLKASTTLFIQEFTEFASDISMKPGHVLMTGDFNKHMDVPDDPLTIHFNELLKSFNLKQLVSGPTHTLDLFIVNDNNTSIQSVNLDHDRPADHSFILCKLCYTKPKYPKKTVTFRKSKKWTWYW